MVRRREVRCVRNVEQDSLQEVKAVFTWIEESDSHVFMCNSYHIKSLIDSYKMHFLEYDEEAYSWSEVRESNIAKAYINFFIDNSGCIRGFSGTGKCTPTESSSFADWSW